MAFIGNLAWFILGGWALGSIYLLGAIILFPLLPFLLPMIGYAYWPFGRQPVSKSAINAYKKSHNLEIEEDDFAEVGSIIKILANVVWVITFGFALAIMHLISGLINFVACIFIFTIPFCLPNALGNFKMIRVALAPFGVKLIPTDLAADILKESAKAKI